MSWKPEEGKTNAIDALATEVVPWRWRTTFGSTDYKCRDSPKDRNASRTEKQLPVLSHWGDVSKEQDY